jgi:hypothetical protein
MSNSLVYCALSKLVTPAKNFGGSHSNWQPKSSPNKAIFVLLAHALSYITRLTKRNKNKSIKIAFFYINKVDTTIQVVHAKHLNTTKRVTDEQTKANLSLGCVPLIGEKQ